MTWTKLILQLYFSACFIPIPLNIFHNLFSFAIIGNVKYCPYFTQQSSFTKWRLNSLYNPFRVFCCKWITIFIFLCLYVWSFITRNISWGIFQVYCWNKNDKISLMKCQTVLWIIYIIKVNIIHHILNRKYHNFLSIIC